MVSAAVPVEQLRALVALLFPADITPAAARMIERLCEEHDDDQ